MSCNTCSLDHFSRRCRQWWSFLPMSSNLTWSIWGLPWPVEYHSAWSGVPSIRQRVLSDGQILWGRQWALTGRISLSMVGMVPCQTDIAPLYSAGRPSLLLADLLEGPLIQIERFGYEKFCKTRFTKKYRSVRRWWSTCWMSMMITIWLVNVSLTLIISNSVKYPRKLCSIFRPWVFIGHTAQKSPSHTRPIRKFPKRARIHVIIYKRSSKSKEKDETEHDCVFSYVYYQPNRHHQNPFWKDCIPNTQS